MIILGVEFKTCWKVPFKSTNLDSVSHIKMFISYIDPQLKMYRFPSDGSKM